MSTTMAVHVRSNSWFIFLLSSANQQHQMTNFQGFWQQDKTTANFSYFYLELNAWLAYSAGASFNTV